MFFVDAVADLADFVVGAFIGNIFMIIREAGSIKNQVAVNMFLSRIRLLKCVLHILLFFYPYYFQPAGKACMK